jgi:hypothetical protein
MMVVHCFTISQVLVVHGGLPRVPDATLTDINMCKVLYPEAIVFVNVLRSVVLNDGLRPLSEVPSDSFHEEFEQRSHGAGRPTRHDFRRPHVE